MDDEILQLQPIDPLPLQNLFAAQDDDLLPAPPSSPLRDQIIQLNFEAPPDHPDESGRMIALCLSVDASPGCGGIAWPAGEVRPWAPDC
jgi:hypothetical protein